ATSATFIGGYSITASLNDPDGKLGNYVVTSNSGTLTINPAPLSVTPDNATRLYGQSNPPFTGAIVGIQNADDITATYGSTATSATFIGGYSITASLNDPDGKLGNYVVTSNSGTLTIDPAPLSVTPDNATRQYGQSNPPFTGA